MEFFESPVIGSVSSLSRLDAHDAYLELGFPSE